jgi:hypothetical protein
MEIGSTLLRGFVLFDHDPMLVRVGIVTDPSASTTPSTVRALLK